MQHRRGPTPANVHDDSDKLQPAATRTWARSRRLRNRPPDPLVGSPRRAPEQPTVSGEAPVRALRPGRQRRRRRRRGRGGDGGGGGGSGGGGGGGGRRAHSRGGGSAVMLWQSATGGAHSARERGSRHGERNLARPRARRMAVGELSVRGEALRARAKARDSSVGAGREWGGWQRERGTRDSIAFADTERYTALGMTKAMTIVVISAALHRAHHSHPRTAMPVARSPGHFRIRATARARAYAKLARRVPRAPTKYPGRGQAPTLSQRRARPLPQICHAWSRWAIERLGIARVPDTACLRLDRAFAYAGGNACCHRG